MLLLNVARAVHRRPMYFTRFQVLRGPMGIGSTTATVPLPFGPDFTQQVYNLSFQHAFDKPSFDVQIMDTQKFLQGITKPVSPKTMLYYLDQGWPQQLILHMFVREVESVDANGKVTDSVLNYPPNKAEFDRFQTLMKGLHACDIVPEAVEGKSFFGPVLPTANAQNLQHLVQMRTADLVLLAVDANGVELPKGSTDTPAGYRLAKVSETTTFRSVPLPRADAADCKPPTGLGVLAEKNAPGVKGTAHVRFVLRSPEAMLYYLGELARVQIEKQDAPRIPVGFPRKPVDEALFQVLHGEDALTKRTAVRVTYEGETYAIPADGGRSTHALSLVSQILNLQNEGAEVPSTATVRLQ